MFHPTSVVPSLTDALAAWLFTYGIHSTLLLAAAALLAGRLSLPSREALWKTALVGGLLTATLQVGLLRQPLLASWTLEEVTATLESVQAPDWSPQAAALHAIASPPRGYSSTPAGHLRDAIAASVPANTLLAPTAGRQAEMAPREERSTLLRWGLLGWGLVAALGLGALGISYRRLLRRLGDRKAVTVGAAARLLGELRHRRRIRREVPLSSSHRIGVPIAHGLFRGQISVPARALELGEEEQESLLAHELAHVARRDPLANLAQVLVELLFVHHPAVRWISRQLRLERECCCDALAVELSGDALEYARALTDLASDLRPVVGRPTLVLNATGGTLMTRIHRLMSPSTDARATARGLPIALLALGVGVGLITPACDEAEPEPRAQVVEADGERTVRFKGEDGELVELKLQPGQKAMHFHKQEGGQIVLVDDGGEGPHGAHAATFIDDKGEVHQLEAGQFHFKGEAEGGALKLELKQGEGGAWVDDQGEEHALDGHEVKFIAAQDGEDAP
ncbi:MAG: hypothetical protein KC636_09690 [Myxococcales bacterium]|nr:hypothetical protein [Myxococcales bacterium]